MFQCFFPLGFACVDLVEATEKRSTRSLRLRLSLGRKWAALEIAFRFKRYNIADLLLERGAKVTKKLVGDVDDAEVTEFVLERRSKKPQTDSEPPDQSAKAEKQTSERVEEDASAMMVPVGDSSMEGEGGEGSGSVGVKGERAKGFQGLWGLRAGQRQAGHRVQAGRKGGESARRGTKESGQGTEMQGAAKEREREGRGTGDEEGARREASIGGEGKGEEEGARRKRAEEGEEG
eukprot:1426100-Rhodomonas_salina.2